MKKLCLQESGLGVLVREDDEQNRTVARLTWGHGRTRDEAIALGRMFAAAPELLEYIRRCASNCVEANELLKKVEGR